MSNKPVRYPWDRWLRQRKFRLVRDRHYRCMTHSMAVQVRTAAAKRGIRVSIHIEEVPIRTGVSAIVVTTQGAV